MSCTSGIVVALTALVGVTIPQSVGSAQPRVPVANAATEPPGGVLVLSCSGCPGDRTGSSLYTFRPQEGWLRRIPRTTDAYNPSWSPDGRSVAYSVGFREIWRKALVGSSPRRLTAPTGGVSDSEPTWSPDGRTILFSRHILSDGDGESLSSFWRLPAGGGRARRLFAPATGAADPDWSPRSARITYSDRNDRLWVANVANSRATRLGGANLRGQLPRWSPDGTRIAFVESEPTAGLSVLEVRTGRVQRVTHAVADSLAWSPDGKWLAFAALRSYECEEVPDPFDCEIFEIKLVLVRDGRTHLA